MHPQRPFFLVGTPGASNWQRKTSMRRSTCSMRSSEKQKTDLKHPFAYLKLKMIFYLYHLSLPKKSPHHDPVFFEMVMYSPQKTHIISFLKLMVGRWFISFCPGQQQPRHNDSFLDLRGILESPGRPKADEKPWCFCNQVIMIYDICIVYKHKVLETWLMINLNMILV